MIIDKNEDIVERTYKHYGNDQEMGRKAHSPNDEGKGSVPGWLLSPETTPITQCKRTRKEQMEEMQIENKELKEIEEQDMIEVFKPWKTSIKLKLH